MDAAPGFIKALPGNVSVIYSINLPLQYSGERRPLNHLYTANAGYQPVRFEIETNLNLVSSYSVFLPRWRALAAGIANGVPGWAITNGGIGWTLDDADAGQANYQLTQTHLLLMSPAWFRYYLTLLSEWRWFT